MNIVEKIRAEALSRKVEKTSGKDEVKTTAEKNKPDNLNNEAFKKKVEEMSVEELCWNLFKITGQINYMLLFSALTDLEKGNTWKNIESPVL